MDNKKHIVAITAFIKNSCGEKFLILKRSADEVAYPSKWTFPGGKLEKGQSVLDTLRREVLEEAGLDIEERKEYLKDFTFVRPDGYNVVGFCFVVQAKEGSVKLGEDFTDYKWILPSELSSYDHIPGMEEEMKIAFRDQ